MPSIGLARRARVLPGVRAFFQQGQLQASRMSFKMKTHSGVWLPCLQVARDFVADIARQPPNIFFERFSNPDDARKGAILSCLSLGPAARSVACPSTPRPYADQPSSIIPVRPSVEVSIILVGISVRSQNETAWEKSTLDHGSSQYHARPWIRCGTTCSPRFSSSPGGY